MLTLKDLDLKDKTVFLRVDFNVPLDDDRQIRDDSRIRAALPTLRYLLDQGARVVAASHLGRPKGQSVPELSLKPVADRLKELLPEEVVFAPEAIGDGVDRLKRELKSGRILLLENLRFHAEEKTNDPEFARKLAQDIEIYVNDAFGTCHRAHASVVAITEYVESRAGGFLVEREVEYLDKIVHNPESPFTAILGGAKVSDKIAVIRSLLNKSEAFLIGGAMAYTFFAAQGEDTARSLVEEDKKELARELLAAASAKGVEMLLPSDHIMAEAIAEGVPWQTAASFPLPAGMMALDIGPATIARYTGVIQRSRTIFWNGPMGVFEVDAFSRGTTEIARAVAASPALSIVGGGDSVAALHKAGVQDRISHISTGGGASLEYIANESLPGLEALREE